jgi:DNA-binding FrmR family transcriptional regulator
VYGYTLNKEDYLRRLWRIEGQVRAAKVHEASEAIARLVKS